MKRGEAYFVKLRTGAVSLPCLFVPRLLLDYSIENVLAPVRTRSGALWGTVEDYSVVVYPFVCGKKADALSHKPVT